MNVSLLDRCNALLVQNADRTQAEKMAAYMQGKFAFAGIPKPKLTELIKPLLKESAAEPLDREFVRAMWTRPYREAQYIALEYLQKHRKELTTADLPLLKQLITAKSWWETVDTLDAFVGDLVEKDASLKAVMMEWAVSDNMWLKRVAIDFQQTYGEKTDAVLLERIIVSNLDSAEFFINKAIGWSLREYSKVNPAWVQNFLSRYSDSLSRLSVREASKYL